MTKDEFITERTRIISEMLDNPNKYGIYPTTKCFNDLDALYDRILALQNPDINTPFFGNSGVKILVTKQNSYPKEFLEWIDSSMKNGVTLRKVYDYWKTNVRDK